MGQKTNPIGLRIGINRTWDSRWFADKDYAFLLHKDLELRAFLRKRLKFAGVSRIIIERPNKKLKITVFFARLGVVIGKKGADIEKLRADLVKLAGVEVKFDPVEVRKPDLDAALVAESIAQQLERRVSFRRAMKRAVRLAIKSGAHGIRIDSSGCLGGTDIARTEWYREGRVPLHTLRADLDYGATTAHTTHGSCGVKVRIYRGDIMEQGSSYDRLLNESAANRSNSVGG